jgi:hypothetical protein
VRTWILTGSPENLAATREHGFTVIGLKERNRARAEEIAPGDSDATPLVDRLGSAAGAPA